MNYTLSSSQNSPKKGFLHTTKQLLRLIHKEKKALYKALFFIATTAVITLAIPFILTKTVDTYMLQKNIQGVYAIGGILLVAYCILFITNYAQTSIMGAIGQRSLVLLRGTIFNTLQSLPLGFFQQNKTGDIISRINNDTEQLNDFFSRSLVQLAGNIFIIGGAIVCMFMLNAVLACIALLPLLVLYGSTYYIQPIIARRARASAASFGNLTAALQESFQNFPVIVVYNRQDYFIQRLSETITAHKIITQKAGESTSVVTPLYTLVAQSAQLLIILFGTFSITQGATTIGVLIGFLAYSSRVYDPLRQIAALWVSLQSALASWDRITQITSLVSDMPILSTTPTISTDIPFTEKQLPVLSFRTVSFLYNNASSVENKKILHSVSFDLYQGKTYALVGPTGGGKTTTASLMARLFDPTDGEVCLYGKDIRTYSTEDRGIHIGYILQEPFLFSGTVAENISYAHPKYHTYTTEELFLELEKRSLTSLVRYFDKGLLTEVGEKKSTISTGQKQIIAFIRAILRDPSVLILDEATANVDTTIEEALQEILATLPPTTTKVIIAHRLHTIASADEIFFVNNGTVIPAGSFDHALSLIMESKSA